MSSFKIFVVTIALLVLTVSANDQGDLNKDIKACFDEMEKPLRRFISYVKQCQESDPNTLYECSQGKAEADVEGTASFTKCRQVAANLTPEEADQAMNYLQNLVEKLKSE